MPPIRRRLVRALETYVTGEDVDLEMVVPQPEPEDIDRVSREHGDRWREHFRGDNREV